MERQDPAPDASCGPTRVTISRADERDVRHRQVIVRLDEEPPVTLLFGDAFTRDISPGEHRLKAHNTLFFKTVRFAVAPGEHAEFNLINTGGKLTLGFLATLGVAPLYLRIERRRP